MKKKILSTLVALACACTMHAQKWELKDMRNLNKISMSDFKSQMKEIHKYSFFDKTESEMFNLFEYESGDFIHKIGKFEYPDSKQNCIEYCTKDKSEFAGFKANLIKLGYKISKSGILYGQKFSDLTKGTDTIRMLIPKDTVSNNEYFSIMVNQ